MSDFIFVRLGNTRIAVNYARKQTSKTPVCLSIKQISLLLNFVCITNVLYLIMLDTL